jgi:hypothetical protein
MTLPATQLMNADSIPDSGNRLFTKKHPVSTLTDKVVMRDKTGTSAVKQQRPKSEYTIGNAVVKMRERKVNRTHVRHSTIEVSDFVFMISIRLTNRMGWKC